MKHLMLKLFALISLVVTVAFASALASVSAQTPSHNITATIPFEFNEGRQMLKSRDEKSMDQELAQNKSAAETVTIVAALH